MIPMAFTNYSTLDKHLVLFDWVGLDNFKTVLGLGGKLGGTFWSVLGWTLIWAVFATFLNFFFGMILAIVINRKETHCKAFWRTCFVVSIAVPQFVSLLVMRQLLQQQGAINNLLTEWGWISNPLPFWTNSTWARVSVILINCWVGIPYSMLQVTGILQNVPAELYEAAKIDGANPIQIYFKITLPYILFIMGPYIITQFTGNINNFNVIYLLSGGDPTPVGSTAGKTDLLVTWLYKLTIDFQYYNLGAVIGILTFIVLSIIALVTYRNTASYKDEEGFQ
jgi:arabinogalactan oligomer/maltooligosaccharide transport system permease protein